MAVHCLLRNFKKAGKVKFKTVYQKEKLEQ